MWGYQRRIFVRVCRAAEAITARGKFVVGISGGSLPAIVGKGFASLRDGSSSTSTDTKAEDELDWSKCHFFFVDERCVALDHSDSNYKECIDKWFGVKECGASTKAVLHPMDATLASEPAKCAAEYEAQINSFFSPAGSSSNSAGNSSSSSSSSTNTNTNASEESKSASAPAVPVFDLLLLGMGPDGHTCSLFPQHKILSVSDRIVAHVSDSPKPPSNRITLTLPLTNAARDVCFVCTGAGKKDALKQVVAQVSSGAKLSDLPAPLPSSLVRPQNGLVSSVWFVDKDAAASLDT